MHRANLILTLVLGAVAVVAWGRLFYTEYAWWYHSSRFTSVVFCLTMLASIGWVLATLTATRRDDETRCRKCRHILRGLSEPRCPECGTVI